ncbi:MAG: UDP-N-acetylglucosamine 2-epimerase (non-hydrolyzing) [Deltaproteobacteria bacterium]|nr:UDP-N-acetylglucosamine 2-epimerase (non-hydrolyzing) [Deltaproteobacteria bacterium]
MLRILTLFGTRPEVIKLVSVIRALESRADRFSATTICSGQHTTLLRPFLERLGMRVDRDLNVMRQAQGPSEVAARVLQALDPLFAEIRPDLLLVQGDTTTAMAGALAGFHRKVPVGHVEAGLRSGDSSSPFPEEVNRRLITQLASYHFAATRGNVETLVREGVDPKRIALTGNPGVDALQDVLAHDKPSRAIEDLVHTHRERRLLVLTTHRREAFGPRMEEHMRVLRRFVEAREDVVMVFPVHPNPSVTDASRTILGDCSRVHLLPPLDHPDFVYLLSRAWLIVSDSGGVQEEVATLGKPLLILRDNTERPEVIEAGLGRLVGDCPEHLGQVLEEIDTDGAWLRSAGSRPNPFGDGQSGRHIADAIERFLGREGSDG